MEQYTDIEKEELRQELQTLQRNIEQHSAFHSDVWQRAVKRHSRRLYWKYMMCEAVMVILVIVSLAMSFDEEYPWWIGAFLALYFGIILVWGFLSIKGLHKADVYSRDGLLSLRDSVKRCTTSSKQERIVLTVLGLGVVGLLDTYLFFHDRIMFYICIVVLLVSSIHGPLVTKRVTREFQTLGEEVDELLKEQ